MKLGSVLILTITILLTSLYVTIELQTNTLHAAETTDLSIEREFSNLSFDRPVDLQDSRDGSNRLFIVEQSGRIYVFENTPDVNEKTLFLDINEKVIGPTEGGNEEGLLGIAFHPDFSENGYFYVDYTAGSPRRTIISRFTVDTENTDNANSSSEYKLLEIEQPYSNHNGGQLSFGPDGYLYIAMGDGGSGGDPLGNAQNPATLLGAILRIDVDTPRPGFNYSIPLDNPFRGNSEGYREEVYAYGLRNPWRFSFDNEISDLWAADVGQNAIEEIDIILPGGNYGWNIKEGSSCYNPAIGCDDTGLIDPIYDYDHSLGNSITGGYVYRGNRLPSMVGSYIYADFGSGRIWELAYANGELINNFEIFDTSLLISSFGVDSNNELYFLAFDGGVYSFHSNIESNTTPTISSNTTTYTNSWETPSTYGDIDILVVTTVLGVGVGLSIIIAIWYKKVR